METTNHQLINKSIITQPWDTTNQFSTISTTTSTANKTVYMSNYHQELSFHSTSMNDQQISDEDEPNLDGNMHEMENMLHVLKQKLNELSLSHEFVLKHSNMLTRSLNDIENIQSRPDKNTIKTINERSTVYKIAMRGVVNDCQEFINLAQMQTKKMHKMLQSERDMRLK